MVSRFGVSSSWFRASGFVQVQGFALGGFEVLGFGVQGFERFVVLERRVFEVQGFEVQGFGYVVSRFEVFKVHGFAYVVSGTGRFGLGFHGSGFRVRGFDLRGFVYGVSRTGLLDLEVLVPVFSLSV